MKKVYAKPQLKKFGLLRKLTKFSYTPDFKRLLR